MYQWVTKFLRNITFDKSEVSLFCLINIYYSNVHVFMPPYFQHFEVLLTKIGCFCSLAFKQALNKQQFSELNHLDHQLELYYYCLVLFSFVFTIYFCSHFLLLCSVFAIIALRTTKL